MLVRDTIEGRCDESDLLCPINKICHPIKNSHFGTCKLPPTAQPTKEPTSLAPTNSPTLSKFQYFEFTNENKTTLIGCLGIRVIELGKGGNGPFDAEYVRSNFPDSNNQYSYQTNGAIFFYRNTKF